MTELYCEDCQKDEQFIDNLEKNKTNLSKYECNDYSLSLIKNTTNNDFEYTILFNCIKCKNRIKKIFKRKEENNYYFKCNKCNLKGITFSYVLSIEEEQKINPFGNQYEKREEQAEDKKEEKEMRPNVAQININSDSMEPKPLNQLYTNEGSDSSQIENRFNPIRNEVINFEDNSIFPQSEINRNHGEISKVEVDYRNVKSGPVNNKKKVYSTPVVIDIIFVKNYIEYKLSFYDLDTIRSQNEKIRERIDLGPNPCYYYNGKILDVDKTFKENKIYNGSYIEIED